MSTLANILVYIVGTLGGLFLLLVILRFLLQLTRADFYNPFSQGIVKITNPLLLPLRKIIPGIFGVDIAAIVLALLIQLLIGEVIALILTQHFFNPLPLLIWGALGILMMSTYIALVCILIIVVASFIAPYSTHPAIVLANQLIDPILRPVRNIIPPIGGFDFSVMFVGMGIVVVQMLIEGAARASGASSVLIVGL